MRYKVMDSKEAEAAGVPSPTYYDNWQEWRDEIYESRCSYQEKNANRPAAPQSLAIFDPAGQFVTTWQALGYRR